MKKLQFVIFVFVTTLFLFVSCSDNDDSIINKKGSLVLATFDPISISFTLQYSRGSSETIDAIIDNSVSPPTASATLADGTIISVDNATIAGEARISNLSNYKYVNNWIYDEMSVYYLWNDLIPDKPNYSLKPNRFFNSLLNHYDPIKNPNGDRFSWIQENYTELLGSLSGVQSHEIGFEYTFAYANEAATKLFAIVLYPKLGTSAYEKGIKRGQFITQVDGKEITNTNYRTIFNGVGSKTLSIADWVFDAENNEYNLTAIGDINIRTEKNFAEQPVYLDSVYTINNKKIGYLVYNFFATGRSDESHEYDRMLMNSLSSIQKEGAQEMILDLRYNGGGRVSTAIALASALVTDRSTNNVLVTAEYNDIVHTALKKESGADYNKDFFIDKIKGTNISVPALNLPKLYVLITGGSASASELVINGLKPYMDVVLIGETTYGKNVGSITIYEDDDPKNKWGMQPIIVKYYNSAGESDFTAGFTPDFEVDEFETLRLVEFGNTEDPLLRVALNQITGNALQSKSMIRREPIMFPQMKKVKDFNSIFNDKSRFEMEDDLRGKQIKRIRSK